MSHARTGAKSEHTDAEHTDAEHAKSDHPNSDHADRRPLATLLVLGATGDLTARLLLPALADLWDSGGLPRGFRLMGCAYEDWSTQRFRDHVRQALRTGAADIGEESRDALTAACEYRQVDVSNARALRDVVADVAGEESVGIYFALPTALVEDALRALSGIDLPWGSRIAVEKPFGHDVASAEELNDLLAGATAHLGPKAIYRVDHVLGMTSLHNLLALRLADRLIGATWRDRDIAWVEILWDETLGLEGRASYYDRAGALRDVMQNHMIQVLSWAAMEPTVAAEDAALDRARLKVLRATSVRRNEEGTLLARRARYTAGQLSDEGGASGASVPDYAESAGVDPERDTETLAEVVMQIDTDRWRHTPFVLRAGKALAHRRKGILVHYRPSPWRLADDERAVDQHTVDQQIEDGEAPAAPDSATGDIDNKLWIGIDGPDDVRLGLQGATLGPPTRPVDLVLSAPVPPSDHDPYGNVLLDFLRGTSAFSVSAEEPVEAWRIFGGVLAEWDAPDSPMATYRAGSDVPPAAPRERLRHVR